MTTGGRVKTLRKELKLTLEKFGGKLGVTKTALSLIENGKNNLTEQMLLAICREFNVNEEWLRTGGGEMFKKEATTLVEQFAREYSLDEFQTKMIEKFVNLDEHQRSIISNYVKSLIEDSTQTEPSSEYDGLSLDELEHRRAEAEKQRAEAERQQDEIAAAIKKKKGEIPYTEERVSAQTA